MLIQRAAEFRQRYDTDAAAITRRYYAMSGFTL